MFSKFILQRKIFPHPSVGNRCNNEKKKLKTFFVPNLHVLEFPTNLTFSNNNLNLTRNSPSWNRRQIAFYYIGTPHIFSCFFWPGSQNNRKASHQSTRFYKRAISLWNFFFEKIKQHEKFLRETIKLQTHRARAKPPFAEIKRIIRRWILKRKPNR